MMKSPQTSSLKVQSSNVWAALGGFGSDVSLNFGVWDLNFNAEGVV